MYNLCHVISLSFLVGASMLKSIISIAKTIILKTHYHSDILSQQDGGDSHILPPLLDDTLRSAVPTESQVRGRPRYENYKDPTIPKRVKITVNEGIDVTTSDDCKHLRAFLDTAGKPGEQEVGKLRMEKTSFELVRKIQRGSYCIIMKTEHMNLNINETEDVLLVKDFTQEINCTFERERTPLPVKNSRLRVKNTVCLDQLKLNLTTSALNLFMEYANIAKAMAARFGLRDSIRRNLLDEKFLQSNVVQINQNRVGTEYEKRHLRIF